MNNGWLLLNDDLTPDLDLDKLQEEEARLKEKKKPPHYGFIFLLEK